MYVKRFYIMLNFIGMEIVFNVVLAIEKEMEQVGYTPDNIQVNKQNSLVIPL